MKYILHYGYHECDGLKIFNTPQEVVEFVCAERERHRGRNTDDSPHREDSFFFVVLQAPDVVYVTDAIRQLVYTEEEASSA